MLYASTCSLRPGKTDQKHQKDNDSMVGVKDWTGHGKSGSWVQLTFNYSQGHVCIECVMHLESVYFTAI